MKGIDGLIHFETVFVIGTVLTVVDCIILGVELMNKSLKCLVWVLVFCNIGLVVIRVILVVDCDIGFVVIDVIIDAVVDLLLIEVSFLYVLGTSDDS